MFHGLFRATAPEAVAPVVSSLWSAAEPGGRATPRRAGQAPQPAANPRRTGCRRGAWSRRWRSGELSLFQDTVPDARALFRGRV